MVGHRLERALIRGPFLLRSTTPPVTSMHGKMVTRVRRLGKRIAIGFEGDLWLVIHLMIAGRLHWRDSPVRLGSRKLLAAFEFDCGMLTLTEAGSQHRACLHASAGEEGIRELSAGGLEVLEADLEAFTKVLSSSNHTLKRTLTDPHLFSGIGNAYSDEILHRAQLSPIAMSQKLTPAEIQRLYDATREVLVEWVDRLRSEAGAGFPEKVTAFREGMAVPGRRGAHCPPRRGEVQRSRRADHEPNYRAVRPANRKVAAHPAPLR